jgi:hypothetical protein
MGSIGQQRDAGALKVATRDCVRVIAEAAVSEAIRRMETELGRPKNLAVLPYPHCHVHSRRAGKRTRHRL